MHRHFVITALVGLFLPWSIPAHAECGTYTITTCSEGTFVPSGGSGWACNPTVTVQSGTCYGDGTVVENPTTTVVGSDPAHPSSLTCNYWSSPQVTNYCGVHYPQPVEVFTGCCETCTPTTCTEAGVECGTIDDGCGGVLDCGQCTGNGICGATQQNICCEPLGCHDYGLECGTVDDGCGNELNCGECVDPLDPCGEYVHTPCVIVAGILCDGEFMEVDTLGSYVHASGEDYVTCEPSDKEWYVEYCEEGLLEVLWISAPEEDRSP